MRGISNCIAIKIVNLVDFFVLFFFVRKNRSHQIDQYNSGENSNLFPRKRDLEKRIAGVEAEVRNIVVANHQFTKFFTISLLAVSV